MRCMDGNQKSHISEGPWGGECGSRWDDGVYCSIRQMIISHGAVVDSIQIEYDLRGCSVWSEKHGGTGGVKTDKIKLDYPDEHLISISGYYGTISGSGPVVVRSLMFESNNKRYGPFGFQKGTHFSFQLTGGKIVGFHGRSGLHLDSLGVYLKPLVQTKTGHTQVVTQNRVGNKGVGAGKKGFDLMAAVRENMDNMVVSSGAFTEYERKEKVFTATEVGRVRNAAAREKEEYKTYGPNHGFSENIGTYDKVFTNFDGGKGYPNPRPYSTMENEDFMHVPNRGYTDFATREKIKGYGPARAEKDYYISQTEANTYVPNKVLGQFETKEKYFSQNTNEPTNVRHAVSYGPWGGNGGVLFDDGVYTGVRGIHVARSAVVVSIRVCYDMNGQAVWGNKNGGNGAFRLDKINFDYPHEFLTHISGYYGSTILRGPTIIRSITFYTNKKKYGPFGDEQGIPFSSGQNDGIIVGFHGRKGWFVDSIGVHFLEGKYSMPRPSFHMHSSLSDMRISEQMVVPGMMKGPAQCGPGPWGGDGGKPWDDGVFTGIRKIFLTKGEAIYTIQIEYDRNGQSLWSVKHGGSNEGSCHVIQFDYPQEVVTCISGYIGSIGGDECKKAIKSLTFHTNRGTYGPYGEEIGTYFTSAKTEGKIIGFHGKSGCYLYAIGVHMQHWMNDRVEQQGPIKMMLNKLFA
ncbi:hypothetical protein UlMin_034172 [Ulmus minor]